MLMKLSEVMQSILSIPNRKATDVPTREGTLLYPLYLPGTNTQEFNDFLLWLYRAEWDALGGDREKERICTHHLKLSDIFAIPDWVRPAVKKILSDNLSRLTDDDLRAIGWKVYSMLVKAKEIQDAETRRIAFVPPTMAKDPSWECQNHASCLSVWPKVWFEKIGRELLHPDIPMRLTDIAAMVGNEETLRHPRLCEPCRSDMAVQCANMMMAD
ncbi:hypothetical protein B0H13DRAFT_2303631 [Mycena leptocephala]|nr:hypothetical protein B0H13DRAFT_2303631 [Mycena leptocephala]